ncbi:MAG: pseudouridine synthase [Planctomycetota bacterium]
MSPPWLLHEDDALLAVHKPAGVNTHRVDRHAQDGIYEWVSRQRPGQELALLQRLDKGTSGVLVLGKTPAANRALTAQLAERQVEKRYALIARADPSLADELRCDRSIPQKRRGQERDLDAVTDFARQAASPRHELWEARPRTGRRHQVRLHAARLGLPIVGDAEYEGPLGARLFLHAHRLRLTHPTSGAPLELEAPLPRAFERVLAGTDPSDPRVAAQAAWEARALLEDPAETDAWLWIDRDHDGFPELRVERLGRVGRVLRYDDRPAPLPAAWVEAWLAAGVEAIVEQRRPRGGVGEPATVVAGELGPARYAVRELGLRYLVDLAASPTSSGLFLDQRETRRRLLGLDLAGKQILNAFAHTGSLSVAAARAGASTLTLDLSKAYLDWARENLELNGLDPAAHDFIYGDALEWLARLAKKERRFDLVLLDPPSSSTSGKGRKKRRWSVERDLAELVARGARLVAREGTLFVSTNLRRMPWERFLEQVALGLAEAGRKGEAETQTVPLDHRCGPQDPPYLKAAWIRL